MQALLLTLTITLVGCASHSKAICNIYVDKQFFDGGEFQVKSVAEAIQIAEPCESICLNSGVYSEIELKGVDGGLIGITITSAPNHVAIIKNDDYRGAGVKLLHSRNIVIKNLFITGGMYGVYAFSSSNLTLLNNTITDVGQEGIIVKAGDSDLILDNIAIRKNKISFTGNRNAQYGEGIYIGDGKAKGKLRNVTIDNNQIDKTLNEAIDIKQNTINAIISNNTISNVSLLYNDAITIGTSSWLTQESHYVLRNNLIYRVDNRSGYRPYGIAIGHGNAIIENNTIIEESIEFVGICLFTTFTNQQSNVITLSKNQILTQGTESIEHCTHGGTNQKNYGILIKN